MLISGRTSPLFLAELPGGAPMITANRTTTRRREMRVFMLWGQGRLIRVLSGTALECEPKLLREARSKVAAPISATQIASDRKHRIFRHTNVTKLPLWEGGRACYFSTENADA